jgi:hypothetical protein
MQRDAGVPSVVAVALEGVVILVVVAVGGLRMGGISRPAPAARAGAT